MNYLIKLFYYPYEIGFSSIIKILVYRSGSGGKESMSNLSEFIHQVSFGDRVQNYVCWLRSSKLTTKLLLLSFPSMLRKYASKAKLIISHVKPWIYQTHHYTYSAFHFLIVLLLVFKKCYNSKFIIKIYGVVLNVKKC